MTRALPGGVRPDRPPRWRKVAEGAGLGTLGGLVATLAMYGVAGIDFLLTGVPESAWAAEAEIAFGGHVGSFLGLSGPALHAVHGAVLGAALGIVLKGAGWVRSWAITGAAIGLPVGGALWISVLLLAPVARSSQGAGPPVVVSLGMHLVFGFVAAVAIALGTPSWERSPPPSSGA